MPLIVQMRNWRLLHPLETAHTVLSHTDLNTMAGETTVANEVLISQLQRQRFLYTHNVLAAVVNDSNKKALSCNSPLC